MTEIWRPIPGHPGYEVSDLGRVRSSLRGALKVLKPRLGTWGYPRYSLRVDVDGQRRTVDLHAHHAVLLAFVGPRPEGMEVRHLSGDKADPRLVNLAYGTHSENLRDQVRHGTHPEARKTHCPRGHRLGPHNLYSPASRGRDCGTCRRAYMALYQASTADERAARRRAGLPVIDLDAYFANQSEEIAA